MRVVGLTGSIATGKSTVAWMVARYHVPVFDADAYVHFLYTHDLSLRASLQQYFPQAVKESGVDRKLLGQLVYQDAGQLKQLEALLHPRVRRAEEQFILRHRRQRRAMCLLDIPLLFETGAERLCDEVWVTYCPGWMQAQRLRARRRWSDEQIVRILARQMPQHEKVARADAVLVTSLGLHTTQRQLQALL